MYFTCLLWVVEVSLYTQFARYKQYKSMFIGSIWHKSQPQSKSVWTDPFIRYAGHLFYDLYPSKSSFEHCVLTTNYMCNAFTSRVKDNNWKCFPSNVCYLELSRRSVSRLRSRSYRTWSASQGTRPYMTC